MILIFECSFPGAGEACLKPNPGRILGTEQMVDIISNSFQQAESKKQAV